ncbi:MAG TPA: protein translocase subunit SecF [Polyangiaceae bacterium]|nr:protein translocase subunit SecF [Polyangiaceae bacterium]
MRLFKSGKIYNFMAIRWYWIGLSLFITFGALVLLFLGKAKLGTDFTGGTEVEIAFKREVSPAELRAAVEKAGFSAPAVVKVTDPSNPNRYLIRLEEVSTISPEKQAEVERALCLNSGENTDACPTERQATEVRFSPGGDKISVRYRSAPDLDWIKAHVSTIKGVILRPGERNPMLQNARDNKVEIQLMSKGDQLMGGLKQALGADTVPDAALRTEWIGPRAGAQLRDSAVKSIVISIVFIMIYIAFRFDLRFAPGCVLALTHDALGMIGVLIVLGKEINLTTIAAALTIVGYSVNDTVIVYDRVRENLGKLRGTSFFQLINISTSEMLGRTILTSSTVVIALLGFFIWGTGELKDFALALTIGVVLGTYSSIYVALPLTEWLDHAIFSKIGAKKKPVAANNAAAV